MIFDTGQVGNDKAIQLEPLAAPPVNAEQGTGGDQRTHPRGRTEVILGAACDVPLDAGEKAIYRGASLDGKGVAFDVGDTLYLRYDNSETFELGEASALPGLPKGASGASTSKADTSGASTR